MTRPIAVALILICPVLIGDVLTARAATTPDRFDGTWNVEIVTEAGTCDRAYRYPIKIEHGRARFVGIALEVQGGVAPNGVIRGTVSNGLATADVRGRLGLGGFGSGRWVASGALECRGHWSAE